MRSIQNFVEKIAVKLICASILFFSISAIGVVTGVDSVTRTFGYLGIFSGLLMLTAGSIMSISFVICDYTGGEQHHSDSTAVDGIR